MKSLEHKPEGGLPVNHLREGLLQSWLRIQGSLFPWLQEELGPLTEKQQQLVTILEFIRIEEHLRSAYGGVGRPRKDRAAIARAFVAKMVYAIPCTNMLFVVTGNIYATHPLKTIGRNHVAVPSHCYKVIFDPVKIEAIAFILPNQRLKSKDLPKFIVSVDEVEQETGLDFLSKINDSVENLIESRVQAGLW